MSLVVSFCAVENNVSCIYKSAKSSTRRILFLDTRWSCFNYLLIFTRCYCVLVVNAVTLYSGGSLKKTRYLIFPLVKVNILDKILAWNFKKKLCSLILMCLICLISSKWIIPPFNFCLLNTKIQFPCSVHFLLLIKVYEEVSKFYLSFKKQHQYLKNISIEM